MTIGTRLAGYVGDRQHKEIALEWGKRWRESGGTAYKEQHLISSFSRLMNGNPQGAKLFLGDRERSLVIYDVLGVPEADRRSLDELVRDALIPIDEQAPRHVVDITPWAGTRDTLDQLFRAVEEIVLAEDGLFPVALVLTDDQFRYLPRTFDATEGRVRIVQINGSDPQVAVIEHAGNDALVASPRPFPDFGRWAALAYRDGKLELEPPDAVTRFADGGRLPALPRVEHPLAAVDAPPTAPLPKDAVELRRLMVLLSSEDGALTLGAPAAERYAMGRALGIPVASTAQERLEARHAELRRQLQELGGPTPSECAAEDLAAILRRAQTRQMPAMACRVEGTLHLVNVSAEVAATLGTTDDVQVDRVTAQVTPLERLLERLAGWTDEDYLRDPFLETALEGLATAAEDERLLAHARTSLLRCGALSPPHRGEPVEDALAALRDLIGGDLPMVTARLVVPEASARARVLAARSTAIGLRDAADPWLVGRWPRVADVLLRQADALVDVGYPDERSRERSDLAQSPRTEVHFPPADWRPDDLNTWLTVVEYSPTFNMVPTDGGFERSALRYSARAPIRCTVTEAFEPVGWQDVVACAAQLWLALRHALDAGDLVRLAAGAALLDLGAGVSLRVDAHKWPRGSEEPVEARLRVGLSESRTPVAQLIPSMITHPTGLRVGSYAETAALPAGLELSGHGVVLTARPIVNPLTAMGTMRARCGAVRQLDDDDD
jgi:hypothetical protein